jgi:hypothetical protein
MVEKQGSGIKEYLPDKEGVCGGKESHQYCPCKPRLAYFGTFAIHRQIKKHSSNIPSVYFARPLSRGYTIVVLPDSLKMASEISKTVHKDADNMYSDQETIEILDDTHEKDATEEVDSGEVIDFKSDGAE